MSAFNTLIVSVLCFTAGLQTYNIFLLYLYVCYCLVVMCRYAVLFGLFFFIDMLVR